MQSIENEAVLEIASATGVAPEVVIRTAVCRLTEAVYDRDIKNVRPELVPELKAEFAIVAAGRHEVTQMLAQRGDESLRADLESAIHAREIFQRGMAHADELRTAKRAS